MRKKKTFEQAKKEISEKYSYLELLQFNDYNENALFLDKEYGEFKGIYKMVFREKKNHPERAKINKKEKTRKTNLEKYGVEYPAQNKLIKKQIKQTNLKKYGVEHPIQNKLIKDQIKQTNLKRYGAENPLQNKHIKEKVKKTNLERYGTEHPIQNKKIQEKLVKTNLKKYGVEHVSQSKEIKEKIKKYFLNTYNVEYISQSKEIKEKIIQTNLKKYGVKCSLQNKEIREKRKQTFLEKYGVEHPLQNKEIKEKYVKTFLERYGVKSPFQLKEIRDKAKQTFLKNYDVENPFQSKKIIKKIKKTNLKNGNWYNINEMSLLEYYNNSYLKDKITYTTIQKNYIKYVDEAFKIDHYNLLHGKSKIANLWLEQIEKQLGYELIREYHIPTTLYHADGYDPKTNTIYEFYGDFWHGNLNKYSANDIHPIKKQTYQEVYNDTIKKEYNIKSLGYNIIYIWENNFQTI